LKFQENASRKVRRNYTTLLLYLLIFGALQGQTEKEKDSLLFLIKYAEGADKLEVSKEYFNRFYKKEPAQVSTSIDELLVSTAMSTLDSADLYYLKTRASYYANDFKSYRTSLDKSTELLANYTDVKNEYYYYLMYRQESINAIQFVHGGQPSKALHAYLSAVQYADKSKRPDVIRKANLNLGGYYVKTKEFPQALNYLEKCLEYIDKHENVLPEYKNNVYGELASAYTGTDELEKAKVYLDQLPDDMNSFSNLITKVNYYKKNGQPVKALALIDGVQENSDNFKGKPRHWLPFMQMLKADNLYLIKKYAEAEKNWLNARISFLEFEDTDNLKYISDRLYKYYKGRGDFEKALIFHEENKMISDSMLYKTHSAVIKGIQDSNDLSLQKQENYQLKKQDEINNLVIQRQNIFGILGLLFIGLLSAFSYIYFKSARTKRELNNDLRSANKNLEDKNQEVESRVQELSYISKNLPQGIGRLNHKHNLTFYNQQMVNHIVDESKVAERNIFELLDCSTEEQKVHEKELRAKGQIALTWFPKEKKEVFQVQIKQTGQKKGNEEYLMVVQDVTRIKENEKVKITAVESELKKMEDNAFLFNKERVALNESLDEKNKELISKMMQISKRDSEIEDILSNLKKLYQESSSASKMKLTKIINQVNSTLDSEDNWMIFNTYFKEIHPNFLTQIRNNCDNLSNNEIRHCTFIKLGLTNKEVSDMLNVSSKTVEVARYRIKKKLNLSKDQSLNSFVHELAVA